MAIRYVRADITKLDKKLGVEAIVNSANPAPGFGGGTDFSIYEAAGKERLLKERMRIGRINVGEAKATSGFDLCRIIIHTVGPVWQGGDHNEFEDLRNCYRNSLAEAKKEQCRTIAFPLISTGVYGFPKDEALNIAVSEINAFLLKNSGFNVIICIFDEDSFVLSGRIAGNVQEFIDRQQSQEKLREEYGIYYEGVIKRGKRALLEGKDRKKKSKNYGYQLSDDPLTFVRKLQYYVDSSGLKPSEIYRDRAWLPRRTWSRIINGTHAPKKETVLALCLALHLGLKETADLLARNSQALDPSDDFDRYIAQCIENKIYDLDEINESLPALKMEDRQFLDKRD